MRKASFADMNCSIAQSLEIVGEWWTLLVLRDVFLGVRRFDDFVERLGISRNVLADRLDKLVAAGVLERRPYDEPYDTPERMWEAEGSVPSRRPTADEALRGPRDTSEAIADLESTLQGSRSTSISDLRYRQAAGTAMERPALAEWAAELAPEAEMIPRGLFGRRAATRWLRTIFPGNSRPDAVIVDRGSRRLIVADVTSRAHVEHIEKSIGYARRLADSRSTIPEALRDFQIVVQERYWEHGAQRLREIIIR